MNINIRQQSPQSSASLNLAILGLCLAVFIASLDTAITNTALPYISQELNSKFTESIWVINSYQLVMVALILPLAVLADQLGYKKVFCAGLIIFTGASLCCGIANSLQDLILARAFQGVGAAAILGTNIALIRLIYSPEKLGLGLGINAFIIAGGLAAGPVIASIILNSLTWHWLFLINIPIGIIALILCFYLPSQIRKKQSFNILSALLTIIMFASIIYALSEFAISASLTWILVFIGVGVLSGVFLIIRDSQHPEPVFPIDLFKNLTFSLSVLTAFTAFVTQGLVLVALPYIFYNLGHSQTLIGFLIAPWPIVGAIIAPIAGVLSNKVSSAYLGAVGLFILGSSITILAVYQGELPPLSIVMLMMFCGLGFGLFLTPNQKMLMDNSPISRSGAAGGMLNVSRILGQAVGAILVAISINFSINSTSMMLGIGACFAFISSFLSFYRTVKK